MANTIDVTEYGSNKKITLVVSNILLFDAVTYTRTNDTVTEIQLVGGKIIPVTESVETVKKLIDN